ncbi:MAG: toll/interleukin-1 receptor domain-containing protein, partial [Chloroflexota bacterium]
MRFVFNGDAFAQNPIPQYKEPTYCHQQKSTAHEQPATNILWRVPHPVCPPAGEQKIFLSYARKDDHPDYNDPAKSFMRRLYDALKDDYDVWWDRESMPSRALTFLDEIQEAIEKSSRLILVVGDAIHDSDYVKAEWQFALSRCIPVIPILRKGNRQTVPDVLRQVHTPKFLDDDAFDEQIAELKRILTDNKVPSGALLSV